MHEITSCVVAAVDAPLNRPIAVFAGAGTGKTTALIARIWNMIAQGIRPGMAAYGFLIHTMSRQCSDFPVRHNGLCIDLATAVVPMSRPA